ncbi:hypothetical protein ACJJTC_011053 [Scirpophaga incertulas]
MLLIIHLLYKTHYVRCQSDTELNEKKLILNSPNNAKAKTINKIKDSFEEIIVLEDGKLKNVKVKTAVKKLDSGNTLKNPVKLQVKPENIPKMKFFDELGKMGCTRSQEACSSTPRAKRKTRNRTYHYDAVARSDQ